MDNVLSRVMDALDVETFLVCDSEEEGKQMMTHLVKSLGFKDVDMVFVEHAGPGARVRARAYIYRPGVEYRWLHAGDPGGEADHG